MQAAQLRLEAGFWGVLGAIFTLLPAATVSKYGRSKPKAVWQPCSHRLKLASVKPESFYLNL